jgi:hypothetical protein
MAELQTFKKGDHIYFDTSLGIEHHGIYCGDNYAIHFDGHANAITKSHLKEFVAPYDISRIRVMKYRHSKTDVNTVIQRAESLLGQTRYDLGARNCEHFATWCKTGKWKSAQVNKALTNAITPFRLMITGATGGVTAHLISAEVAWFFWVVFIAISIPLVIYLIKEQKPHKVSQTSAPKSPMGGLIRIFLSLGLGFILALIFLSSSGTPMDAAVIVLSGAIFSAVAYVGVWLVSRVFQVE